MGDHQKAFKMAQSAQEDKEKRKRNFSEEEKQVMTDAIVKYDDELHGAASKTTSQSRKHFILRRVTSKVNAIGHESRTPKEIGKKWHDMKRRVRDKLARIKAHVRGTGGGRATTVKLTPSDEAIATVLANEQIEGIEGVDSAEYEDHPGDDDDEPLPSTSGVRPVKHGPSPPTIVHSDDSHDDQESVQSPQVVEEEEVLYTPADVFYCDEDSLPMPPDTTPAMGKVRRAMPPVSTMAPLRKHTRKVGAHAGEGRTQWDTDMLSEQRRTADTMCTIGDDIHGMKSSLHDIAESAASAHAHHMDSNRDLQDVLRQSMQEHETSTSEALLDVSANSCAIATTLHLQNSALDDMHTTLAKLTGVVGAQTNTLLDMAQSAKKQAEATAAVAVTCDRLVLELANVAQALRDNTVVVRTEGTHLRRLIRLHSARSMRLHGDTHGTLTRVANALEGMHSMSDNASRSTTPSEDGQASTSQPQLPVRQLRSRKPPTQGKHKDK